MATVLAQAQAILNVLDAISYVDSTSVSDFLPAVTTQSATLLALPMGQRDAFTAFTLSTLGSVHRLRFELWVKHAQGQAATTMARAREFGRDAARLLYASDDDGYMIAPEEAVTYEVDEILTEVHSVSWLVGTLVVPVLNNEAI
jgi:hypothetical protein